ncbi:MAG: Smr/MutS family protein [Lentisphaeraceae bacterium]|nr:Smr/MutS family protein [Lentisphaeraceae bacterium]
MIICEMCGEDIDTELCPFCGTENSLPIKSSKKPRMASINIKEDLPTVDVALNRVKSVLSQKSQYRAVKIIHGYGSSGKGGVIKDELHHLLFKMLARREISGWIPGEEFSGDFADTLELLKKHPFLEGDSDHRRRNKGVTIVVF